MAPDGTLFVATPAVFVEQFAVNGDELDGRRSVWTAAELESLGFQTVLSGDEPQIAFTLTILAYWSSRR